MEIKHFAIEELKATEADDGARTIEGFASVFNNVDAGKDIVLPGAFTRTLKAIKTLPMLWQHDTAQPIGVWTEFEETQKGLRVKGTIVDTTLGLDAYKLAKAGAVKGLSIGYSTKKYEIDSAKGVRKLVDIDLFETSLVTFPMNEKATVTDVKTAPTNERDFEEFLRDAGYSRKEAKTIISEGYRAIPKQRDADAEELEALHTITNMFNQIKL